MKANLKGEWEVIRDLFGNLRERMNSKFENHDEKDLESISSINLERAACLGILQKEIEKSWPSSLEADKVCCHWLDEWCQAEPENPDARWIRLHTLTAWAWHARSGARARDVSQTQFDVFFARLRQAKSDLDVALELFPPHDPVIYSDALTLARGLEDPMETKDAYLVKLMETADPHYVPAHCTALQAQCEKWGGSHARMFALVRRVTKDLPAAHPLWVLIPMALRERTLFMGTNAERVRFRLSHPELRRELLQAYEKALGGDWETTLDPSLSAVDRYYNLSMRNWFLSQLHVWGKPDLARKQARVIGKRPTESCWHCMGAHRVVLNDLGFDVSQSSANLPIVTATAV